MVRGVEAARQEIKGAVYETGHWANTELVPIQRRLAALDFRSRPRVHSRLARLGARKAGVQGDSVYELDNLIRSIELSGEATDSGVTVCNFAIGDAYRQIVSPCVAGHEAYARRHGHGYRHLSTDPPPALRRPLPWMKVPLLLKLLRETKDDLFYIDADALITNPDRKVEPLLARLEAAQASVLLTEDDGGANAGVMFVRNCDEARDLFELVWLYDVDVREGTWEQFALHGLMNHFPEARQQILIEPDPKLFNSFPVERRQFEPTGEGNIWSKGDFVCHFSCVRQPHLQSLIAKYADAQAQG